MKTVYQRQFAMMAAVILAAFVLLGGAFVALSYQYITRDKREVMERNAAYVANFTGNYLSTMGSSIEDRGLQLYITSQAEISDSVLLIVENDGSIVYASSGEEGLRNGTVPAEVVQGVKDTGSYNARSSLGGLFPEKSFVTAVPILQHSYLTGSTYQLGMVVAVSDSASLVEMWRDLAVIFLLTAAVVLLLASAISSVTSRWQTRPLQDMAETVRAFGRGEFDRRVEGLEARHDEVGELAEAFNTMAEDLARSEQRRSEFIANVSHELKTPMTTIAGFADGILDGTIPREKEADALTTISNETRRLSRLVRRMLDVSRLQSSEGVVTQERFDISELLIRVLVSLEGKINDRHLDVETDLPEGPVMVWGDPDSITQVCYNLLDNAIKFASEGTALGLRIQVKGEKAYVSVRDTGETIPPEELGQVFDRFHKADKSRSEDRDGWGLGLYIVKTILNNHRENITVTSEDGVTEFTFTLTIA